MTDQPRQPRGRPRKPGGPASDADRSRAKRTRAAERAAARDTALAAALRKLHVEPSSPAAHDVISALASALMGCALDVYAQPGESGPDGAFRAVVRAVVDAASDEIDTVTEPDAGLGAIMQAMDQVRLGVT